MFSPRLPGREEYLTALDQAVHHAIRGDQTPQQALTNAANEWEKITGRLGIEPQRKAYVRSLGLEP
jgi:multiple sugar transport system substrate-binding protein